MPALSATSIDWTGGDAVGEFPGMRIGGEQRTGVCHRCTLSNLLEQHVVEWIDRVAFSPRYLDARPGLAAE
jgi:hypothetical protein